MTPMIETAGGVKRFGKTAALHGLDLVAEQGSDPRGAGTRLRW
jgi:hypothetical protein